MAREPQHSEDSPADGPADGPDQAERSGDKAPGSKRTRHLVTGAAIGIGSAALVAALLYANRSRKGGGEGG